MEGFHPFEGKAWYSHDAIYTSHGRNPNQSPKGWLLCVDQEQVVLVNKGRYEG